MDMFPRAAPGMVSLDRTLTYRLHMLHKLTDHESHQVYMREMGCSLSDGRCLATIGTFEPLSVNHLAQQANLNKSQASRAAQLLIGRGLVRKQDSSADGRGVVLSLTPAGRKAWVKTMALIIRRNEEIFGCLSEKERDQLGKIFDRIIDHVRPEMRHAA